MSHGYVTQTATAGVADRPSAREEGGAAPEASRRQLHDDSTPRERVNSSGGRFAMVGQLDKACRTLESLLNPRYVSLDRRIPLSVLRQAKGIAFVTVAKAGFMFSGTVGTGIVIARTADGDWSGPVSIGVGGMGFGALVGGSVTDAVIILNSDRAVKAWSGAASMRLGGEVSITTGPVGREANASAHLGKSAAACFSYSHSKGLFLGSSLQGAIIGFRSGDTRSFYGCAVKTGAVLRGEVRAPHHPEFLRLKQLLNGLDERVVDLGSSSRLGAATRKALRASSRSSQATIMDEDEVEIEEEGVPIVPA